MRANLVRGGEFRNGAGEIAMFGERNTPRIVTGRNIGAELHRSRVPELRAFPVAAQTSTSPRKR